MASSLSTSSLSATGAAAAPSIATTSSSAGATDTAFTAGGVTIQADAANNALIVMAPEPLYNNIRAIVDKLDSRRAQVYVEALIVEVSADRAAEFGIQWQHWRCTRPRMSAAEPSRPRPGNNIIDTPSTPRSEA
jgi:general secretion pathway protein D